MSKKCKQGWQCPVCMTVYAPQVEKCECAKVPVNQWWLQWPYYRPYPYWPNWSSSGTLTISGTNVATDTLYLAGESSIRFADGTEMLTINNGG